jgi:hypothetical protein
MAGDGTPMAVDYHSIRNPLPEALAGRYAKTRALPAVEGISLRMAHHIPGRPAHLAEFVNRNCTVDGFREHRDEFLGE